MRLRFADCVLDVDRFELSRAGRPVAVQPKVLDLLLFLLRQGERTVSKQELLDAVWPDVATGESSLTRAVSFARAALGERERDARVIRTVRGRGYRIGVPVALEAADEEAIDLHVFRLPFVERLQTGETSSEIVDRDTEAMPAQLRDGVDETVAGGRVAAFGDLDADVGRRKPCCVEFVDQSRQRFVQRRGDLAETAENHFAKHELVALQILLRDFAVARVAEPRQPLRQRFLHTIEIERHHVERVGSDAFSQRVQAGDGSLQLLARRIEFVGSAYWTRKYTMSPE